MRMFRTEPSTNDRAQTTAVKIVCMRSCSVGEPSLRWQHMLILVFYTGVKRPTLHRKRLQVFRLTSPIRPLSVDRNYNNAMPQVRYSYAMIQHPLAFYVTATILHCTRKRVEQL